MHRREGNYKVSVGASLPQMEVVDVRARIKSVISAGIGGRLHDYFQTKMYFDLGTSGQKGISRSPQSESMGKVGIESTSYATAFVSFTTKAFEMGFYFV